MKLTNRQFDLIRILVQTQDFVTVKELASELQVSVRTIHNDLNEIESHDESIKIIRKRGVGVKLDQKKAELAKLTILDDVKERALEIFRRMLFEEENLTIRALADEYYVSASSIVSDLNFIKNELISEGAAELISDSHGTRLSGSENQIQRSMLHFNEKILECHQTGGELAKVATCLQPYYGQRVVQACLEVVLDLEQYNLYSVAHYYEVSIFSALVVTCYRLMRDKHPKIVQSALILDEIMAMKHYLIAKDLLEMLALRLDFGYYESDIYVLSMYLQAYRLEFHPSQSYVDKGLVGIARRMIHNMSSLSNVSIEDDSNLFHNLVVHLYHMVYRRKNDIEIKNPLLEQIKNEFRVMYDLSYIIVDGEKKALGVEVSEDEVGFIMLHFQSAIDKKMQSKRLLVVCPYGVVSSDFIVNRIRRILPPLDIIESTSVQNVERFDIENIDLIVSTVPLPKIKKEVVVISQLATEKDLEKVVQSYQSRFVVNSDSDELRIPFSSEYFDEDLIFFKEKARTREEIIDRVSEALVSKNYVLPEYRESLLERERNGGTEIVAGAALPHGSFDLVKQTSLPIWINETPVKWGTTQASVIIFFAIAKDDLPKARKILDELFKLLRKKEHLKVILAQPHKQALLNILGGSEDD